jgi:hypothetical protein
MTRGWTSPNTPTSAPPAIAVAHRPEI